MKKAKIVLLATLGICLLRLVPPVAATFPPISLYFFFKILSKNQLTY